MLDEVPDMSTSKMLDMSASTNKKEHFCSPLPLSAKRLNKFISAK